MRYDTIIIMKVDQKLSDLFQGTHSQTFNKVKKSLWLSPLLNLKLVSFAKSTSALPNLAVHLNLIGNIHRT